MFKTAVSVVVVAVGLTVMRPTQNVDAEADGVAYHDLTAIPSVRFGSFPEAWMVVTQSNSFSYVVVPSKYHQTPHRHSQEQFSLALGGSLDYSVGGGTHRLGAHGAVLPPSNVTHGMSNDGDGPALVAEFQPVRRDDWLPPYPRRPSPTDPEAPLVPDAQVTLDFGLKASGWQTMANGARTKSMPGRTIRATFWDLSAAGASADITARRSLNERFVFVIGGRLMATVGEARRDVGAKMVMVVNPSARQVSLQSQGTAGTEVVVFEVLHAPLR
jgi:quercetin dioxygenase-like cupin family protein